MSDTAFQVGDRIRSYDFQPMPDRPDQYVEGVIDAICTEGPTAGMYRVRVETDTVFPDNPRDVIHTPWEGTLIITEFTGRITKVETTNA